MDRPPLQAPLLALDCAVRPHSPGLQQLPRSPRGTQWPQGSSVTDCAADSLSVALPAASRMATMFPNRTKMLPNFQAISRVPFPESGVRHSCMSLPPKTCAVSRNTQFEGKAKVLREQSCRRCEVHGGKQWHFPSAPRLQDISGPQPDSGQPVPHALASPLITSKLRGLGRSAAAQQRSKALIPRGPRDFES